MPRKFNPKNNSILTKSRQVTILPSSPDLSIDYSVSRLKVIPFSQCNQVIEGLVYVVSDSCTDLEKIRKAIADVLLEADSVHYTNRPVYLKIEGDSSCPLTAAQRDECLRHNKNPLCLYPTGKLFVSSNYTLPGGSFTDIPTLLVARYAFNKTRILFDSMLDKFQFETYVSDKQYVSYLVAIDHLNDQIENISRHIEQESGCAVKSTLEYCEQNDMSKASHIVNIEIRYGTKVSLFRNSLATPFYDL